MYFSCSGSSSFQDITSSFLSEDSVFIYSWLQKCHFQYAASQLSAFPNSKQNSPNNLSLLHVRNFILFWLDKACSCIGKGFLVCTFFHVLFSFRGFSENTIWVANAVNVPVHWTKITCCCIINTERPKLYINIIWEEKGKWNPTTRVGY